MLRWTRVSSRLREKNEDKPARAEKALFRAFSSARDALLTMSTPVSTPAVFRLLRSQGKKSVLLPSSLLRRLRSFVSLSLLFHLSRRCGRARR
jgi:hypothetical protein